MTTSLLLLASRLVAPGMSVLLVMILARRVGQQGMGEYATVMALVTLFTSASSLGLRNVLIREVGRRSDSASAYAINACAVVLAIATCGYVVLVSYVSVISHPAIIRTGVVIAGIALWPFAVSFALESVIIALRRNDVIVKATFAQHAFRVGVTAAVLSAGASLHWVFGVFVAGNAVLMLQYGTAAKRMGLLQDRPRWHFIRDGVVRALGAMSVLDVVANVYAKLGTLVLSRLSTAASVGLYAAATGLTQIVTIIPANMALSVFPRFASMVGQVDELASAYRTYVRHTVLVLIPVMAFGWAYAPAAVRLVYGGEFYESARLFRIAMIGVLPYSLSIGMSYILLGTNRHVVELRLVVGNTVMSLLTYVVLVRFGGALGAASATAVSPVPLALMQAAVLRLEMRAALRDSNITQVAVPLGCWCALVGALRAIDAHVVVAATVGIVAYAGLARWSQILTVAERSVLGAALGRLWRSRT